MPARGSVSVPSRSKSKTGDVTGSDPCLALGSWEVSPGFEECDQLVPGVRRAAEEPDPVGFLRLLGRDDDGRGETSRAGGQEATTGERPELARSSWPPFEGPAE